MTLQLGIAILLSYVAFCHCRVVDDIQITRPIEGLEGEHVVIYCITDLPNTIPSAALEIRVGSNELPVSQRTYLNSNTTHREVLLLNLDRRDFVSVTQDGDNGMPLACAFSEFSSNVSVVTVIYNDFVTFTASSRVNPNNTITISLGEDLQIPLNISANPAQPVISRLDGAAVSSGMSIDNNNLTISQAGRDIAGSYNITVSNQAGVTSITITIEVQFAAIFNPSFSDFCQTTSSSEAGVTVLECYREEGSEIQLDCSFEAFPAGVLSVSFNGADLSANAPNNVVLNGSTIVISNFNPDVNVGEYKCSVTNTIGGVARWSAVSFGLRETEVSSMETTTASATTIFHQHYLTLSSLLLLAILLLLL